MKTCRRARRWIELSFAGELALDDQFRLEEHTSSCEACRARLADARRMLELLEELPAPPEEHLDLERSLDAIHARLDDDAGTAKPGRAWRAAAAALVLVGIGATVWGPRGAEPESTTVVADADHEHAEPNEVAVVPEGAPASPANPITLVTSPDWTRSDLDGTRLDEAKDRVRELLLEAAGESSAALERDERENIAAFVARVDELGAPLARPGWPVDQIAAGFVDDPRESDPKPAVARAALRYLGLRGNRVHLRALESALERPALALAAVHAVADLGLLSPRRAECRATCERLLAESFWKPELTATVGARILDGGRRGEGGGPGVDGIGGYRIEWVWLALERAPHARGAVVAPAVEAAANDLPDLLAGCGTAGARALLELGQHPLVRMDRALRTFAACPEAEEVLVAALDPRERDRIGPRTLLAAIELLRPDDAWRWLRDQAWHGPERGRAAYVLAAYPGARPVDALLELALTRRVASNDLLAAFRRAIEVEPPRMTELALLIGDRDDPRQAERYLEWLVLAHRPAGVAAMLALVEHGDLGDQERERALLAAGEIGSANEAPLVAALFARLDAADRELAAAALISLHRLGGADAARVALDELHDEPRAEILLLLADAMRDSATTSALYRLERALEPLLRARSSLSMRE